jgi:hypothetical protein
MREYKTRWVLGTGYLWPSLSFGCSPDMSRDKDGGRAIHISRNIPKSALTRKNKYRLVLEIVEPIK